MSESPQTNYVPTGVWRVLGASNTLYLAATAHLVTPSQVPFPSTFYSAYHDSQVLYMEIDPQMSFFAKMSMVFKMVKWMKSHDKDLVCPPGRTLADYLSPGTIDKLKTQSGKNYRKKERMTPLMLAFLSEAKAWGNQMENYGGVEDVFVIFARKDRKPIRALDDKTIDNVVMLVLDELLLELRRDIVKRGADAVIEEKVFSKPKLVEETDWRRGDLTSIDREVAETQRESPELYQKLAVERNHKWLAQLIAALQSDRNAMALVGSYHMGGPDGLLRLLQQKGYMVEQMYGVDEATITP
jgi:uncharacterized protein YbaP (TraB family)